MKHPGDKRPEGPLKDGDGALGRLRQFEKERGLDQTEEPDNPAVPPDVKPNKGVTDGTSE